MKTLAQIQQQLAAGVNGDQNPPDSGGNYLTRCRSATSPHAVSASLPRNDTGKLTRASLLGLVQACRAQFSDGA